MNREVNESRIDPSGKELTQVTHRSGGALLRFFSVANLDGSFFIFYFFVFFFFPRGSGLLAAQLGSAPPAYTWRIRKIDKVSPRRTFIIPRDSPLSGVRVPSPPPSPPPSWLKNVSSIYELAIYVRARKLQGRARVARRPAASIV